MPKRAETNSSIGTLILKACSCAILLIILVQGQRFRPLLQNKPNMSVRHFHPTSESKVHKYVCKPQYFFSWPYLYSPWGSRNLCPCCTGRDILFPETCLPGHITQPFCSTPLCTVVASGRRRFLSHVSKDSEQKGQGRQQFKQ